MLSVPLTITPSLKRGQLSGYVLQKKSSHIDNRSGSRMATEHLLAQGCQTIGHVTGPLGWWQARQRKLIWRDALENARKAIAQNIIVEGSWDAPSGRRGLLQFLEPRPEIGLRRL
jgi:DNA-binding LacI/PurR family transcriptional regulator